MEIASLVVSLLGLLASLWAVVEVRRLRGRYLRMAKLPVYLRELDSHLSELSAVINDFEARKSGVAGEIGELRATLEAIERVQSRSNTGPVADVRRFLQHTGQVTDLSQVQAIYERVRSLKRQLDYQAGEDEWT